MTLIDKIAWDDTVLPFQLDRADVRGRIARLDGVLSGVLKQHDYPPAVEALVAEMALLTALIGQNGPWPGLCIDSPVPRDEAHSCDARWTDEAVKRSWAPLLIKLMTLFLYLRVLAE